MIIYGKMTVDLVVFISARDLSIPVYHKLQVVTFLFILKKISVAFMIFLIYCIGINGTCVEYVKYAPFWKV